MSSHPADSPPAWNATERSRAQTRALLTALARDRKPSFARPPFELLLTAVVTLGFHPLVELNNASRHWHRLLRSQLREAANWIATFQPLQRIAEVLRDSASDIRASGGNLAVFATCTVVGFVLATSSVLAAQTSTHGLLHLSFEQVWRLFLLVMGFAFALRQDVSAVFRWRLDYWLRSLNELLESDEKRNVSATGWPLRRCVITLPGMLVLLAQALTSWPVVLLLAAWTWWLHNRHVEEMRKIHLQLIERLLEWMDDSGLPVEYDVVALNPDEIAAMIG